MDGGFVYADNDRPECAALIPQATRRVLDVGCAYGGFGRGLKSVRPDVEVWGVEQHPDAAAVARGRLDRVIEGLFPECIPQETFDAVTFLDVLEHLVDPWAALEQTRRLLTDNGVVVASIPNIRNLTVTSRLVKDGRWDYTEDGILDRTHLRFFTKSTIGEMFVDAGFTVVRIVPLFFSAPPAARTKTGLLMRMVSAATREEFLAIQYGVVARPNL